MADIASMQTPMHYTLSNKGSKRPFTIPPFLLDMRGEADEFFCLALNHISSNNNCTQIK